MGSLKSTGTDTIVLYTNHTCTWANRADICLAELGLPYEARVINVDGPRPASFLALNPRGLVPVLVFNGEVICESRVIAQFLCDAAAGPHHLCPSSSEPGGALARARMALFVDAYWASFHTVLFRLFEAPTPADEERAVGDALRGLAREVEPLLLRSRAGAAPGAGPFWGASARLTLVEVITGPFVIRALALSRRGVYPRSLAARMRAEAPACHRWAEAVCAHEGVRRVFDEDVVVARSLAKRARMRAAAGLPVD